MVPADGPPFLSLLNLQATTTMAPPTNTPAREGRSALEDTLGNWLNNNHQAELADMQEQLDHANAIAASAQVALNDAIRYYNQWHSLDEGVGRVLFQMEEILALGPTMCDRRMRHVINSFREGLWITRRIAIVDNFIDLTTDEEMDEDEEHAIEIDLTQE